MPYLVGADEAGYGPNLGPLVVSATVWRVDSIQHTDLFTRLRDTVRQPGTGDASEGEVLIGDSKALYKPGKGLAGLEQGVFPCLAAVKKKPRTWQKIWQDLAKWMPQVWLSCPGIATLTSHCRWNFRPKTFANVPSD